MSESQLPSGWAGGEAVTKWWRGQYVHLYRLRRYCARCGAVMTIDVTKAAIEGTAKNSGLHLKSCPECRAKKEPAASKPTVLGSQPLPQPAIQPIALPPQSATRPVEPIKYGSDGFPISTGALTPDLSKILMGDDGWTVEDEITQLRGDLARTQRNLEMAREEIAALKIKTACPRCTAFDTATEKLRKEWLAKNPQSVPPYTGGFATQAQIDAGLVDEWRLRQNATPENNSKKLPWET